MTQRSFFRNMLLGSLAFVCAMQGGCKNQQAAKAPVPLVLFAGAGIRSAADSLIAAFEKRNPGVRVIANFGGSGQQLGQIATSGKGDLFMPGDGLYVDLAIERGLAEKSTRRAVAFFIPVIQVKNGNPLGITSVADLTKMGVRVGLGDPRSVAVGQNSLKILAKAGIDSSALAANLVYHSGTVTELAAAVELGTIDAAIVWDATARNHERTCDIVTIPLQHNEIATIPVVLLKTTRARDKALAFAEFAASTEGKRLFAACGYTVEQPADATQKQ